MKKRNHLVMNNPMKTLLGILLFCLAAQVSFAAPGVCRGRIFYLGEEGNIHGIHSVAKPQRVIVVLSGSLSISLLAIEKAG
uniref:Uncharacterized protein n=1 Tax=Candidatus Kentrum sp. FM TaxID=2126340 RepID=A0A450TW78_9GAMM|nr:MAG: hypothetical protein BECKFM1743C_GA0114222_107171 [Candidatus Kentron sp. FM]VFJ73701.1 MAG: hypothetical protein BECKFM1743A_GA0114220_107372 [Candidatus Kentron sp. FM]VFK20412.1 MAG: hypothetical protein BECKFM1743B_GA0114221_106941 [Candidatus Kentron sp. FM]